MTKPFVLGVDGGGSKTDAVVLEHDMGNHRIYRA